MSRFTPAKPAAWDSSRSKTRFGAPSAAIGRPSSSTTVHVVSPSEIVSASIRVTLVVPERGDRVAGVTQPTREADKA